MWLQSNSCAIECSMAAQCEQIIMGCWNSVLSDLLFERPIMFIVSIDLYNIFCAVALGCFESLFSSLYSLIFWGSLPVCWPAECRVATFSELDWVGNSAACPSFGCHGPPAMGRVWGGRSQWGGSPLLVQCSTGSPSFWTQAGPQLCRRGAHCPKTDCGKCSQLLHTQLGQHKTLTHTWKTHVRVHDQYQLWISWGSFLPMNSY